LARIGVQITQNTQLLSTPLADLLNPRHELNQLANLIEWKTLDQAFRPFFAEAKCLAIPRHSLNGGAVSAKKVANGYYR
jgi:hypothetical protein